MSILSIQNADILERSLRDTFGTKVIGQEPGTINTDIILAIDAYTLIDKRIIAHSQLSSTTANAWNVHFTVPINERWWLNSIRWIRPTGSTVTYQVAAINSASPTTPLGTYIYFPAAASADLFYQFPQPVLVEPGETLALYNNTAGTDPMRVEISYRRIYRR